MRRVSRKKRKNNEHGSVENFTTKTNICRYIVETRWQIQSADTQCACAAYIIRFAVICNELLLGAPKGLLPLSVLRASSAYVLLDSIAIFMDSIAIYLIGYLARMSASLPSHILARIVQNIRTGAEHLPTSRGAWDIRWNVPSKLNA